MKHTPEPWEVLILDDGIWVGMKNVSEELWLCDLGTRDYEEWEANAYLIAAAPELYEALCRIEHNVEDGEGFSGHYCAEIARDAIAKVKGEK